MIEFHFTVHIDGLERGFNALADSLDDEGVRTALMRTGGHIRGRARRAFAASGPGWAPLSPETVKRKITSEKIALLSNPGRGKTGERSIVQRVVRDAAASDKWS